jgi:hypothetical protein
MVILPDVNGDVKFVGEKWGTRAKSNEKGVLETTAQRGSPSSESGLINALMKMLVVSHEAQRSGVEEAQNGTPLALRA